MEIETIRYFLSVAKCLNFSQAAEENHISQSSFSKAIMRLERDLGVKLIDRSSHPISLTEAGLCFRDRMREIAPQFESAISELEKLAKSETLHLFICPRSYKYKLAFDDYLNQHDDIHLQIDETSDLSCVADRMQSGKYDFAITPLPLNLPDNFKMTTIYDDELYLLVSDTSHFAGRESVSLMELEGLNVYESPFYKLLLNFLAQRYGFQPKAVYPLDGQTMRREECIHRISLNKGVGVYSGRDLVYYRNPHIRCIPIQEVFNFPVVLLENQDAQDSPAKARFRSWVLSNLEVFIAEHLDMEKLNHSFNK